MFLIGLTGGICTGKSFVLGIFDEMGCFTMRADELARSIIFAPGSEVAEEIAGLFGPGIYSPEKGLDKERYGRLLFEDPEKRQQVNQIVHPLVQKERSRRIKEVEELGIYHFLIYESALLVEAGIYKDFEKIIVVYTSRQEQVRRLMERDGSSRKIAEKKIQAQFPLKEKLKVADYTIDTSGSFEATRLTTLEVFHLMQRDLGLPEA